MGPSGASTDGRPSDAEESTSPVDLGFLGALDPASLRAALPSFLANFVEDGASDRAAANRERIAALVAAWPDEACRQVIADLGALGREHRPYPANPNCRDLSRLWCHDVVVRATVEGAEHLRAAVDRGPALVCCNHLSYVDSTATDAALAWSGHADLADRLIAAAGPKVYQDLFRLIAASCLNTLPVPQSTSFTHTEKLSARDLARKASESLQSAADAMASGYVLLLYPEGSRSRTGHMGSFLRGAHRYLTALPDLSVVPLAIAGTEALMPVSSSKLRAGEVALRFGAPLRTGPDGNGRELLATAHAHVAAMLPPHLAPADGTPPTA